MYTYLMKGRLKSIPVLVVTAATAILLVSGTSPAFAAQRNLDGIACGKLGTHQLRAYVNSVTKGPTSHLHISPAGGLQAVDFIDSGSSMDRTSTVFQSLGEAKVGATTVSSASRYCDL